MIGKSHFKAALIGAGTAVLLGVAPAGADEMDDLKAKVDALEKQLATSVSVGGFVKGDFYLDSHDDLRQHFHNGTKVRLDGDAGDDDEDGAVGAHARQSRARLSTSTDTPYGALNTVVEGDFWAGDFRLRLAYGELGPVLAGRAWSIRGDNHTTADTVEAFGPAGVVADRFAQIRLTLPLAEGFTGQMAVEPGIGGSNELPTFLAALRYSSGWGAVNVTGAVGRYDDGGQNVTDPLFPRRRPSQCDRRHPGDGDIEHDQRRRADLWCWVRWTMPPADASGDLEAQDSIGGFAGISHGWTDSMRSGVYFGWVQNDNPDGGGQDGANAARQCHLEPGVAGRYRLRGHPRYARDQRRGEGRGHAPPDRRQVQLLGGPSPRSSGRRRVPAAAAFARLHSWATP